MGKGTSFITGGKGRYAGAKGDATYEGELIRGPDGVGRFDNVINIKHQKVIATGRRNQL
jgi:hypothetical protein